MNLEFLNNIDLSKDSSFVLYVLIFVGVLLSFEGLRSLLADSENEQESRNRRMRMLKKGATQEEVYNLLTASNKNRGLISRIDTYIKQSGLPIGFRSAVIIAGILTVFSWVVMTRIIGAALAQPAAVVLGTVPLFLFISIGRSRRLQRLAKQLPDALDLMARGLKVGHPLPMTIESVAREMPDPIGTEFGLIHDQVSFGDTLVDAFSDMADRLDTEDVRYLSVSVSIQYGTGGNLARVLGVLSRVIRERTTMKKKIKAISAEGRISAFVLSVLPLLIAGLINTTSPSFYADVWDDPIFLPAMGLIGLLIVAQAFILIRMVKFDF